MELPTDNDAIVAGVPTEYADFLGNGEWERSSRLPIWVMGNVGKSQECGFWRGKKQPQRARAGMFSAFLLAGELQILDRTAVCRLASILVTGSEFC